MITDFLKKRRTKAERKKLMNALDVIREFKESSEYRTNLDFDMVYYDSTEKLRLQIEFLHEYSAGWKKLNQLERFLEHLTEGKTMTEEEMRKIASTV
ncbi:MAG: hypothetical protein GWN62_13860 [Aliifodinibius sp.]|nr:hypothetical protein [Fodinibius sp.]